MNNVLIALDLTPSSQYVAETGYSIAKKLGVQAHLVHVLSDAPYYPIQYLPIEGFSFVDISNSLVVNEELQSHAGEFLKKMAFHLGDETIPGKVLDGNVYEALLQFAKECGAGMIVVGVHERKGFTKLFQGETSVKLLHNAQIPILVVPCKD